MDKHTVKTPIYEGPLDLLLSLIAKNEVDIYNIPIFTITEQYMDYIYGMNELDIEIASEFIVMAAKLIEIKSKLLLPPGDEDEEEIDPREELVQRLLEYKLYKAVCEEIKVKEASYLQSLGREPLYFPEADEGNSQLEINPLILTCALKGLLSRRGEINETGFDTYTIETENYTIEERMLQIIDIVASCKKTSFFSMIKTDACKNDIIVTFLSVLELLKLNKIKLFQSDNFDDILIEKAEA